MYRRRSPSRRLAQGFLVHSQRCVPSWPPDFSVSPPATRKNWQLKTIASQFFPPPRTPGNPQTFCFYGRVYANFIALESHNMWPLRLASFTWYIYWGLYVNWHPPPPVFERQVSSCCGCSPASRCGFLGLGRKGTIVSVFQTSPLLPHPVLGALPQQTLELPRHAFPTRTDEPGTVSPNSPFSP